jgi:hypothetical protein
MPVNLEFAVLPKASKRASLKRSALASLLGGWLRAAVLKFSLAISFVGPRPTAPERPEV